MRSAAQALLFCSRFVIGVIGLRLSHARDPGRHRSLLVDDRGLDRIDQRAAEPPRPGLDAAASTRKRSEPSGGRNRPLPSGATRSAMPMRAGQPREEQPAGPQHAPQLPQHRLEVVPRRARSAAPRSRSRRRRGVGKRGVVRWPRRESHARGLGAERRAPARAPARSPTDRRRCRTRRSPAATGRRDCGRRRSRHRTRACPAAIRPRSS